MNKYIKIASIILILCFCASMTSCNDDFESQTIYFTTTSEIKTLDPQLAETNAELTVAKNCFEGLLTKDENGNIVNGMAESYTVSEDGLTYKFKIKENLFWSDKKTKVTSNDFSYGIKRALNKKTQSPYAALLFSVKNGRSYNKGTSKASTLGIKTEGQNLIIELEKKDLKFEETLTKPLCSPCNQDFFEKTTGKYGLSTKDIITNGSYKFTSYNIDNKILTLYKNSEYSGNIKSIPQGVSINYNSEYDNIYKLFSSNDIDIADVQIDYLKSLEKNGNDSNLLYNTNYVLFISNQLKTTTGTLLSKALMLDIDKNALTTNISDYYKQALGIIPDSNTVIGSNYRKEVGKIDVDEYNINKSKKALGNYEDANNILSGEILYYPKDVEKLPLFANLIVQGWQKDLNAYINTSQDSVGNIFSGIKSGEIKIAIIPISNENDLAYKSLNILSEFGIINSVENVSSDKLYKIEKELLNNYTVYPLLSIPQAISFDSKIQNINFSNDGKIIDFRFAKKSK